MFQWLLSNTLQSGELSTDNSRLLQATFNSYRLAAAVNKEGPGLSSAGKHRGSQRTRMIVSDDGVPPTCVNMFGSTHTDRLNGVYLTDTRTLYSWIKQAEHIADTSPYWSFRQRSVVAAKNFRLPPAVHRCNRDVFTLHAMAGRNDSGCRVQTSFSCFSLLHKLFCAVL